MKQHARSLLCGLLALTAVSSQSSELPPWSMLEYQQTAFWVTARSTVQLRAAPDSKAWQLLTESAVASNSERVDIRFEGHSGRVLERERLSKGKNQRLKRFTYRDVDVTRERSSPAEDTIDPASWPITSQRVVPFPAASTELAVTNSYPLLLLAERALTETGQPDVLVHTDFNFYRVAFRAAAPTTIVLSEPLRWDGEEIAGERGVLPVEVHVEALSDNPDKYDFSVLGLSGDIRIYYDEQTRLPLQIRGRAPRVGKTQISLISAQAMPSEPGVAGD